MRSFFRMVGWYIGVFLMSFVSVAEAKDRLLVVSFSKASLSFYEKDALVAEFPVVVPLRAEEPPKLPVRGVIRKVEKNPHWYPTKRTQEYYLEKRKIVLPKVVKSDNPLNTLGTIRVVIQWSDPIKPTARIHGTNEPELFELPPEKRHRSGGCVRLLNGDAEKLAGLIQSSPDFVRVLYVR